MYNTDSCLELRGPDVVVVVEERDDMSKVPVLKWRSAYSHWMKNKMKAIVDSRSLGQ
jgi:hypothetical protein